MSELVRQLVEGTKHFAVCRSCGAKWRGEMPIESPCHDCGSELLDHDLEGERSYYADLIERFK